jgi:glycosyltransferase involved in cell wall biosynthesis
LQSKNNKICITSISLGKGGAERSAAMLTQMLDDLGYEVHLVVLNDDIDFPFAGKLLNLGKQKKDTDPLWNRIRRFKRFKKYLAEEQIKVVIDHRPKNNYLRELYYANYVYKGLERIYVFHSSNQQEYLTRYPQKFVKLCNRNKANVGVSEYISSSVLEENGVEQVHTIHNAFDVSWAESQTPLPEQLRGKKYILSYGRMVDQIKDFSFLIRSFSASELWKQDIYLVLLGDGPDKPQLQKLAAGEEGGSHILFLPFSEDPFAVVAQARFVTLTSTYEGFPMVLVEALSLGTPVISLDIRSGPSEIIRHRENGLLIQKRSIPLFAEAMKELTNDDALYEKCRANARMSVSEFSMKEIAQKWHSLLQHD